MVRQGKHGFVLGLLLMLVTPTGWAKPVTPLGMTAFDGGVASAEALGRGGTIASNLGTPASGSENPAALTPGTPSGLYTTVQVGSSSELPKETVEADHPLGSKILQYLSIASEKGILFFEPLGREDEIQILDPTAPSTNYRDMEFAVNAVGFAGAQEFRKNGSFGLSIAYLRANLAYSDYRTGLPVSSEFDSADGVRLNLGFRYPTGPAMWGVVFQNAPAYLWWKDHKRQILPVRIRVGNTVRIRPGMLFSVEGEQRYYNEGSRKEDYLYLGYESIVGDRATCRVGVFSSDIEKPEKRHWTGGLTFKSLTGIKLTYAIEQYELNEERIRQSYLSVLLPFSGATDEAP